MRLVYLYQSCRGLGGWIFRNMKVDWFLFFGLYQQVWSKGFQKVWFFFYLLVVLDKWVVFLVLIRGRRKSWILSWKETVQKKSTQPFLLTFPDYLLVSVTCLYLYLYFNSSMIDLIWVLLVSECFLHLWLRLTSCCLRDVCIWIPYYSHSSIDFPTMWYELEKWCLTFYPFLILNEFSIEISSEILISVVELIGI